MNEQLQPCEAVGFRPNLSVCAIACCIHVRYTKYEYHKYVRFRNNAYVSVIRCYA